MSAPRIVSRSHLRRRSKQGVAAQAAGRLSGPRTGKACPAVKWAGRVGSLCRQVLLQSHSRHVAEPSPERI